MRGAAGMKAQSMELHPQNTACWPLQCDNTQLCKEAWVKRFVPAPAFIQVLSQIHHSGVKKKMEGGINPRNQVFGPGSDHPVE